jgi:hypothetical protein
MITPVRIIGLRAQISNLGPALYGGARHLTIKRGAVHDLGLYEERNTNLSESHIKPGPEFQVSRLEPIISASAMIGLGNLRN